MFLYRPVLRSCEKFGKQLHTSKILQNAKIIDGKRIAEEIELELKATVIEWKNAGNKAPKLAAVMVGDHPASATYVKKKMQTAHRIGIDAVTIKFGENISQAELLNQIHNLNVNPDIDGIIVQLPVPEHINEREASQAVIPSKDVDGFHLENMGNLALDINAFIPATALGVKELIVRSKVETFAKNAVVVGRSKHVGLPIALLLHSDSKGETGALDMTTTICHRYTPREELIRFASLADVLVVAAGVPGLITKEMVKPGACVIDVGISRVSVPGSNKSKLVGDVDFENVKQVAGHITPVPGGVGPMTVAMLMKNTIAAAIRNKRENQIPMAASARNF